MTKRNLLFVSLLLVFGLCAMAPSLYAQGTVWSASSNQNEVRSEGDAEAVGTITLTTTSTGTIMNSSGFTIYYSLPIQSYKGLYAVGVNCSPGLVTLCKTEMTVVTTNTTSPLGGQVQITFTGLPGTGYTVGGSNWLTVAVREQVQGQKAGTLLTGTITAFFQFQAQSLTLTQQGTSGVGVSLGSVGYPATQITFKEGPEYVLTCIGVHDILGTAYDNDFALRITENWGDAITSLSDEYSLENNDSNNLALGALGGATKYPTNGSNILITLTGVPNDGGAVGIIAHDPVACVPAPSTASNYCALGNLWFVNPPVALAPKAPYGSTQAFGYVVSLTNVRAIEFADFGFKLWSKGPLPPNMGYEITATVSLTDKDFDPPGPPTDGDMPWFSEPEPPPVTVVYFFDCVTKLLFPYINTFGGGSATTAPAFSMFGTGIDIANTTWDPFALPGPGGVGYLYPDEARGSAIPQYGTCSFYFYPSDETKTLMYTTPPISAGGSFAFDVFSALGGVSLGVHGTGYAIAICGFQNAHGFAEIYDNYANIGTKGPNTILGYIPEVLPDPAFYHRSPAGDGLGEGAVAPVDLYRQLLKALMGIVH